MGEAGTGKHRVGRKQGKTWFHWRAFVWSGMGLLTPYVSSFLIFTVYASNISSL